MGARTIFLGDAITEQEWDYVLGLQIPRPHRKLLAFLRSKNGEAVPVDQLPEHFCHSQVEQINARLSSLKEWYRLASAGGKSWYGTSGKERALKLYKIEPKESYRRVLPEPVENAAAPAWTVEERVRGFVSEKLKQQFKFFEEEYDGVICRTTELRVKPYATNPILVGWEAVIEIKEADGVVKTHEAVWSSLRSTGNAVLDKYLSEHSKAFSVLVCWTVEARVRFV